jgi:hypothetical protein
VAGRFDHRVARLWARRGLTACGQGLVIGLLSFVAGVPLLVLAVLSIGSTALFGIGVLLVPVVMVLVRTVANERRRLAWQWSGTEIPAPYRPRPRLAPPGVVGAWQRFRWQVTDPATWRDLLWLLAAPVNLLLGALTARRRRGRPGGTGARCLRVRVPLRS